MGRYNLEKKAHRGRTKRAVMMRAAAIDLPFLRDAHVTGFARLRQGSIALFQHSRPRFTQRRPTLNSSAAWEIVMSAAAGRSEGPIGHSGLALPVTTCAPSPPLRRGDSRVESMPFTTKSGSNPTWSKTRCQDLATDRTLPRIEHR